MPGKLVKKVLKIIAVLAGTGLFLVPLQSFAARQYPENWYQERWCNAHDGELEVVMPDNTRCDCVTATHAIEFDFADKWTEAIGQSLHYGLQTGKTPGIVLIIEEETDLRYWSRLNAVIEYYTLGIDTWKTDKDEDFTNIPVKKAAPWLYLLLKH